MTAGERLRALAGVGGTAGALLLLIGSGATAGTALVDYSGLPTATAAVHLMTDVVVEQPCGGWEHVRDHRRTKEDIRKAREKYGLAFEVIETVAFRQSKHLHLDEQQRFDELAGELKLHGLELEAKHLEYLNNRREALISAEIGKLLRIRIEEEEIFMMLACMVENRMI